MRKKISQKHGEAKRAKLRKILQGIAAAKLRWCGISSLRLARSSRKKAKDGSSTPTNRELKGMGQSEEVWGVAHRDQDLVGMTVGCAWLSRIRGGPGQVLERVNERFKKRCVRTVRLNCTAEAGGPF